MGRRPPEAILDVVPDFFFAFPGPREEDGRGDGLRALDALRVVVGGLHCAPLDS